MSDLINSRVIDVKPDILGTTIIPVHDTYVTLFDQNNTCLSRDYTYYLFLFIYFVNVYYC